MAETTEVTYSDVVHQAGGIISGVWADVAGTFQSNNSSSNAMGLIFDFSSLWTLGSTSLPLERPGIRPKSITLTASLANNSEADWQLWAQVSRTPEDFSSSNLPDSQLDGTNFVQVASATYPVIGTGATFVWQIGQSYDGSSWSSNATFASEWAKAWAAFSASPTGLLSFVLFSATDTTSIWLDDTVAGGPSITADHWDFHTGHDKGQPGQRAVYCQRSARPVGADELQEDGWREGIWVTKDWWEPEDETRERAEISDTERERDDIPAR